MNNDENNTRNFKDETTYKGLTEQNVLRKSHARRDMIFVAVSFVMLFAAGAIIYFMHNSWNQKHLSLMEVQRTSFTDQLTERDSLINEWVMTFNQIEFDLNIIKEKEKLIAINSSSDVEFSKDSKQKVLEDIQYINSLLDENKQKIATLNSQLQKSGGAIKGMQVKVAALEESIKQREQDIAALKTALTDKDFEIGNLNTRMSDLQTILAEKDEKITIQEENIINQTDVQNTAYLAYGTSKDLKERGLVSMEGGFLGLGKKGALAANFNDSLFSEVKITETTMIPVHSKNVKFITTHPVDSYELFRDEDSDQIAYIEIKNPNEFWRISKYAVMEIGK